MQGLLLQVKDKSLFFKYFPHLILTRNISSVCRLHNRFSRFLPHDGWSAARRCSSCNIQVVANNRNTRTGLSGGFRYLFQHHNHHWDDELTINISQQDFENISLIRSGLAGRVQATTRSAVSPSTLALWSALLLLFWLRQERFIQMCAIIHQACQRVIFMRIWLDIKIGHHLIKMI